MNTYFLTKEADRVRKLAGLPTLSTTEKLDRLLLEIDLGINLMSGSSLNEASIKDLANQFVNLSKNPKKVKNYFNKIWSGLSKFISKEEIQALKNVVNSYNKKAEDFKSFEALIKDIIQHIAGKSKSGQLNEASLQKMFFNLKGKIRKPKLFTKIISYVLIASILFNSVGYDFNKAVDQYNDVDKTEIGYEIDSASNTVFDFLYPDQGPADQDTDTDNQPTVDVNQNQVKVSFEKGEWELTDQQANEYEKEIQSLLKDAPDGSTITVVGSIDKQGGPDNMNNPGAGLDGQDPGKTGLDQLRASQLSDIAQKVIDSLDKKISINTETKVGERSATFSIDFAEDAEVDQNSKPDLKGTVPSNQVPPDDNTQRGDRKLPADRKSNTTRASKGPAPLAAVGRSEGSGAWVKNKYLVLIEMVLPLITNGAQLSEEVRQALEGNEKNYTFNDKFVNRRLEALEGTGDFEYVHTPDEELNEAINILHNLLAEAGVGNQIERISKLPFQERVPELIKANIIATPITYNVGVRIPIIVNVAGKKVAFYRSSQGTSGKEKGKWYPFFGFGKSTTSIGGSSWLIKGNDFDNYYNSAALKKYANILNTLLNWDPSIDKSFIRSIKDHPFLKSLKLAKDKGAFNKELYGVEDLGIVKDGNKESYDKIADFINSKISAVNDSYNGENNDSFNKNTEEKPDNGNTETKAGKQKADIERRKKLSGWEASYELAKIAKAEGTDLSKLSREAYAEYAIKKYLKIDDSQLRANPKQRNATTAQEAVNIKKEAKKSISEDLTRDFHKFSYSMIQLAGEPVAKRYIAKDVRIREGTKNSNSWLYFAVNNGANFKESTTYKSYFSLKNLNDFSPEMFKNFMIQLQKRGYNGDIKIFQDLNEQGPALNDQVVMHGYSEADAKLASQVAKEFYGSKILESSYGKDETIDGESKSYSQILSDKIQKEVDSKSIDVEIDDLEADTEVDKPKDKQIDTKNDKTNKKQTTPDDIETDNQTSKQNVSRTDIDTKAIEDAKNILIWARNVKKRPQYIGSFINSLDSKLDPETNLKFNPRVQDRPGSTPNQAAYAGQTIDDEVPNESINILNNLLNELITEAPGNDWSQLPDFDLNASKSNVGALVAIYKSVWGSANEEAIRYVSSKESPYRAGLEKFLQKHPVIKKIISKDLRFIGKGNNEDKYVYQSMDSKQDIIATQDALKLTAEKIAKNKQLLKALDLIDKPNELKALLVLMFQNLPNFNPPDIQKVIKQVRTRLVTTKGDRGRDNLGRYTRLEEDEEKQLPDLIRTKKIIDAFSTLKTPLYQINTVEEATQFVLRIVLPAVNERLRESRSLLFSSLKGFMKDFSTIQKDTPSNPEPDENGQLSLFEIIGKKEKFMLKNLFK